MSSSKREMICFVMASGTRRYKAIGAVWLDYRRDTRHRHGHQPPTRKAIHPRSRRRLLAPPQMPKVNTNPPVVSASNLLWSANVQKRGASSMRTSRRAT
jgi:hypothetical protein